MQLKKTLRKRLEMLISVTCALALAVCLPTGGYALATDTAENVSSETAASTVASTNLNGTDTSAENTESAVQSANESDASLAAIANSEFISKGKGTIISQTNGQLNINRISHGDDTSMGDQGTWTIMVYMCGSDLESDGAAATADITEMLAATGKGNVTVVIQTGGCKKWDSTYSISNNKIQRWVIDYSSGSPTLTKKDELSNASMGDSATLRSFINYGVTNYPADNMGFIFWDHGGGSIGGACQDENYDDDCLTLAEIDAAFVADFNKRSDRFEFIGFDTCLMGTLETANMLTPYARYMFGSEEQEPGCGWNYTPVLTTLISYANKPATYSMTGTNSLSTILCDNFYKGCVAADDYKESTLACFDLSNMDNAIIQLNNCFKAIGEKCTLKEIAVAATSAENYGGNTASAGYVNMIDILDFVNKLAEKNSYVKTNILPTVQDIIKGSTDGLVSYSIHGSAHPRSYGVSMYYPLCLQGTAAAGTAYGNTELNTFAAVCPMNYYFALVEQLANSAVNKDAEAAAEKARAAAATDSDDVQETQKKRSTTIDTSGLQTNQGEYADLTEGTLGVESIHFNDEGYLTLRFKSLDEVNYVLGTLYMEVDGTEGHEYYLGTTDDVVYGERTVEDNFDGTWPSVKADNGNIVYLPLEVANISDSDTDYVTTYTCQAKIDGEDVVLRIESTCPIDSDEDWSWHIMGYSKKTENGIADRTYPIPEGAKVQVVYDYTEDGWDTVIEKVSDTFTYTKADDLITCSTLSAGVYYYGFVVVDLYGNEYYSEQVPMEYDSDGNVWVDKDMVFSFGDTVKSAANTDNTSTVSNPTSNTTTTATTSTVAKTGDMSMVIAGALAIAAVIAVVALLVVSRRRKN